MRKHTAECIEIRMLQNKHAFPSTTHQTTGVAADPWASHRQQSLTCAGDPARPCPLPSAAAARPWRTCAPRRPRSPAPAKSFLAH
eukprot:661742-Pleurochrysis_carterae.AAC.3